MGLRGAPAHLFVEEVAHRRGTRLARACALLLSRSSARATRSATSLTADAANVLYNVVDERQIRGRSMIFTTNKQPKRWGGVLHDDDLADAIVDRILERGRLLRLDGPSLRTKHLPEGEPRRNSVAPILSRKKAMRTPRAE